MSSNGNGVPPQAPVSSSDAKPAAAAAGMKRPSSDDNSQQQLSEKKLRRLEKNRLSARECRRRKREATENLEREINVLEGENLRLRLQLQVRFRMFKCIEWETSCTRRKRFWYHLQAFLLSICFLSSQIGEEAEESLKQEQDKLTEGLDALLKSGASEVEIFSTIEEFKEKFADYGRDRRSAIEFHLRNVERLLMPTRTTSVALRALHGVSGPSGNAPRSAGSNAPAATAAPVSPTASTDSAAPVDSSVLAVDTANPALQPKAMFQYLVNYLQVTPEQAAALKDSRWVAQELDESLVQALRTSEELRTRLTQCGKDLEAEFNTVRSILTPTQAAKFLVWVANNSACMHMLNELWSRVYPQPSDTSGAAAGGAEGKNAGNDEKKEGEASPKTT